MKKAWAVLVPIFFACSSDDGTPCVAGDTKACESKGAGFVCEEVSGGTTATACFAPLTIKGKVIDGGSQAPIANARVLARDANGVALSGFATSAADGTYSLTVPAQRDAAGVVLAKTVTLRADAQGYQPFPAGIRISLPFDLAGAVGTPPILEAAPTTIALFSTGVTGMGRIAGKVVSPKAAGAFVIAQGGSTAIATKDGDFVIFNVAPGAVEVRAYVAGVNIKPATATVVADTEVLVTLNELGPATGSVHGSVSIVNAPGGSITSVVLALEETFIPTLERGAVPPGLRAGNVTGAFDIAGVPDGKYYVLAAFENDNLVRDPDPNIAGTQLVKVTIAGAAVDAGGFKVTEAIGIVSPGKDAPEKITGTPNFVWKDDSSETGYSIVVYDTFGKEIWKDDTIPGHSGGGDPSRAYAGPALVAGQWYQWRVTSLKTAAPISRSEELRGVFIP